VALNFFLIMSKILITGGSGFIGTNLIESLKGTDAKILSIDIEKPKIESHTWIWRQVDIRDRGT